MAQVPVKEAAMQALIARLQDATGLPVERNRRAPLTDDDFPRLVIQDGSHVASADEAVGEIAYTCRITVECNAAASSDAELGVALTAQHAEVVAALTGTEIPVGSAGLTTWPVEESADWDFVPVAESERATGATFVTFRFDLRWPIGSGPYTTA